MPGLSTFKPDTSTVELTGGQTVDVRGLSITDAGRVFQEHASVLDGLYQKQIVASGEDLPDKQALIQALVTEAPEAVATIIALAADEPEQVDVVRRMTLMDQAALLLAVATLTFRSEAELGKLAEVMVQAMNTITEALNTFAEPSLPSD